MRARNPLVLGAVLLVGAGCFATTFGNQPTASAIDPDVYEFTLYKNTFATREYMDEQSNAIIRQIMQEQGYQDYKILRVESGWLINEDTFQVKFFRQKLAPVG